ncbi:MAG: DEAD/DEAH box helicase family protein [Planctomycetota bacterium]
MTDFPPLQFTGTLRPSQREAVEIARRKLAEGHRRLHIVAPPGSGKTILGLYLWAECVRRPALILSPNSAIQAQWATKAGGFCPGLTLEELTSTDSEQPRWLTSLTYQAVTLPRRGNEDLDAAAVELWLENLIQQNQARDADEAQRWIDDLRQHNPDYHGERLASYRKQHRDALAQAGQSLPLLHDSSRAVLQRLKDRGVGLIVLDECHHLLGHWGRVLADAHDFLDGPVVVGLTATPPDRDGKDQIDLDRYDEFFGPIDYEVPIPAVVKDGFLSPYQDLAYFVRPTSAEIDFVANIDDQFHALVRELCAERTPTPPQLSEELVIERIAALPAWLTTTLAELRHPTGTSSDWNAFEKRDPMFAQAARVFLLQRQLPLPDDVPPPTLDAEAEEQPETTVLVPVIDRYVRHGLRRSPHPADRELAETAIQRMRLFGVQITETGCQTCASPAGRVIAYSKSKMQALPEILRAERAALGDRIRAVIVTDYEKTSAVSAEISHLLDEEAGGAMAAFRALLGHPDTDSLDPVLLTGSSVLVDDDLAPRLKSEAETWLKAKGFDVELSLEHSGSSPLSPACLGRSKDSGGEGRGEGGISCSVANHAEEVPTTDEWKEEPLTLTLSPPGRGARGQVKSFAILNGRGADWCPRVYVALITELFQRGLTRCLVGTRGLLGEGWDAHKINVLIDLTTVTTSMSVNQLRGRSFRLDPDEPTKLANNWDVVCLAPEFTQGLDDYHRLIRKHGQLFGVTEDGVIEKGIGHVHAAFTELKPEGVEGSVSVLNAEMLARVAARDAARERWKIGQPYHPEPLSTVEVRLRAGSDQGFPPFAGSKSPWTDKSLSHAIGMALLGALTETRLIATRPDLQVGERSGGYVRIFLENASKEESALFAESLQEIFAPLHKPRYVIPRSFDRLQTTWLSRLLPGVVGRYFQRRESVLAMWHGVPSALAKNRDLVSIFERHWQTHVSPGEAKYAYTGEGADIVQQARRSGQTPHGPVHVKEVFL